MLLWKIEWLLKWNFDEIITMLSVDLFIVDIICSLRSQEQNAVRLKESQQISRTFVCRRSSRLDVVVNVLWQRPNVNSNQGNPVKHD